MNSASLLAKNGIQNTNFVNLLLIRKTPAVLKSIEHEIECQILEIKKHVPEISHIDGHEHVHIIPSINKIVRKLAKKYDIGRVREINENFFQSARFNLGTAKIANFIKLFILRFLSFFNENEKKVKF